MSVRQSAILAEIETQRAVMGTRAATLAGDLAETKTALAAALAETEAQRLRADEAEAKAAQALAELKRVADEPPRPRAAARPLGPGDP